MTIMIFVESTSCLLVQLTEYIYLKLFTMFGRQYLYEMTAVVGDY